jgi:farnesyl diphosphate synthase
MSPQFDTWATDVRQQVEAALGAWVPQQAPAGLGEAMRYAVLGGGKRLRALLVFATAKALGGMDTPASHETVLRAAVAVELIHAYSLVHDDLPCMDNDVIRRGKPTVHVQFGEAQAMLAGDAMQALAFEVLTPEAADDDLPLQAVLQARMCRLLAKAAGEAGMAGGQAIDLSSVGKPIDLPTLQDMHRRKTGALLNASVLMGAAGAGLSEQSDLWDTLSEYGQTLGLAFQIVDDILDVTCSSDTLGKTAGKDAHANKPTYVSLLGLEDAQHQASQLRMQALDALACASWPSAASTEPLVWLMDYVVNREH